MIRTASSKRTVSRALSILLGALLLPCADAHATPHQLALELFEEGNWMACRTECARVNADSPVPHLELLHAICGLRQGKDARPALRTLCSSTTTPASTAAMAHYEIGRAEWIAGDDTAAFTHLHHAFTLAPTADLHRRAGCTLSLVLKETPQLAEQAPGLELLLRTCRKQWSRALRAECRKPESQGKGVATAPARWLVAFYQTQIGPAIGDRCSLHPTCSRYATQALQTHGLVGIAAMGDRFVREPSVVSAREKPIVVDGHGRYADPLSNHDGWLRKQQ